MRFLPLVFLCAWCWFQLGSGHAQELRSQSVNIGHKIALEARAPKFVINALERQTYSFTSIPYKTYSLFFTIMNDAEFCDAIGQCTVFAFIIIDNKPEYVMSFVKRETDWLGTDIMFDAPDYKCEILLRGTCLLLPR